MKIVLSPAKSLNFEKRVYCFAHRTLIFKRIKRSSQSFEGEKPADLSDLMSISDKLADLNWKRNQVWKTPFLKRASSSLLMVMFISV
jgi:cytoplasmic iron level regulating protein YaaA (DUF328/UPF0246 family)